MRALALALVLCGISQSLGKVSASFRGPSYYNERTAPFNISVGFTQPVDGVTASIFQTTACTIQAVYMEQPKTVFVLSVQPNADSSGSGGLSNFVRLFLPTDSVDQGNNAAFFSSQYSPNADARVQASISAPSYYIASQKTVTANVVFERGPINSADYKPLSTSSLGLSGGTVTDVTPRCTFGQCLNYDVELTPRATGTMRLTVQQDALGAASNAATRSDAIQFDGSGTNIDRATLEYTGATSYGPTTTQIFGNIRITPPVDANNVSESILQLSSSGFKLGSFQAFESSFGTPGTLVRFTLFPTTDENFTISVAENVFAPPGNKNFTQLIRFDPNAGGGGTPGGGGDRPIRFALQGPDSYSESNSLDIPLTLQVFLSAQQKQNIGNPLTALNGNNFRVTGGFISSKWLRNTWPAEDYDDASNTYFFNVSAQAGDGGRFPSVQVQLESFPNATFQRGPLEFIRYTSESPTVQVGIEGPAFYTVGNDSANNPVPRPLYVTIRLNAPISRPDLFPPSKLTITGGRLVGPNPNNQWNVTSGGTLFVAAILPVANRAGQFSSISVTVPGNDLGFSQGNFFARKLTPFTEGAAGVQRPNATLEAPATHNGVDPFLVTATLSSPVRPPSTIDQSNDQAIRTWLVGQLVALNGFDNLFGDVSVSFPTTVLQFQINPTAEADISLFLPSNSFALPGNEFASLRVTYAPDAPGPALPSIFTTTVHQGPTGRGSEFDGIQVTIQFSKEMPGIQNRPLSSVVQVEGATILNNRFSQPFSASDTTLARLQLIPTDPTDIVITVPANVLGSSGQQNVQATRTVTYQAPPATVILTGPSSHQGRGSTVKVVASFDRPVTGMAATCLQVTGTRAFVSGVEQEDTEGRDYSFTVSPAALGTMTLQILQGCVNSVGEEGIQNYASKALQLPYTRPPPAGAPATLSIIAPRLHDGSEPFKATFSFNKRVSGFTADSISVQPEGIVSVGGADASTGSQIFEVTFFFNKPQTVDAQVALNVSVAAGAVTGGSTPAWTMVKWDQFGPAPTPLPSPAPPCQQVTCSGHGQCRAVTLPGSDTPVAECNCQPDYSGYNCGTVVPDGGASCFDGRKDSGETDVDCGGPCTRRCTTGFACSSSSDCESGAQCFAMPSQQEGMGPVEWTGRALLLSLGMGTGVCQSSSIAGAGAGAVVTTTWVMEGVSRGQFDTGVTSALRTRVAGYISAGEGGAPAPSAPYAKDDVLVVKVADWAAPSPSANPTPSTSPASPLQQQEGQGQGQGQEEEEQRQEQEGSSLRRQLLRSAGRRAQAAGASGVAVTVQVNIKTAADEGTVRSVMRSVRASGQLLGDLRTDLSGFPVSSLADPGDGSSSPQVSAAPAQPSSLPGNPTGAPTARPSVSGLPVPTEGPGVSASPGASGGGGKGDDKGKLGLEVALGLVAAALVIGVAAGALVMFCRQKSDSQRLAERQAAETTGQQYRTEVRRGEDGVDRVVRIPVGGSSSGGSSSGGSKAAPGFAPAEGGAMTRGQSGKNLMGASGATGPSATTRNPLDGYDPSAVVQATGGGSS